MRARCARSVPSILLALLAACGGDEAAVCLDEACPTGQACQDGACVPLEPPAATSDLGRYTAVDLRPDGRLVVATWDAAHTNLVLREEQPDGTLVTRVVAGWRTEAHELVDTDSGRWPALAVDAAGAVHLAWHDADAGALRYGRVVEGARVDPELVDGADGSVRGTHASLAVADDGTVHVAYRDETARRLRYARRAPGGGWDPPEVLPACAGGDGCGGEDEDYGEHASLVLVAGQPRVAFYDRRRGDLAMAERGPDGTWAVATLDGRDPATGMDTGDVGRFACAAVDPKRRVGVAYFDATRGALRYVFPGGPSPAPLRVDAGTWTDPVTGALRNHPVGQHVALRYDGQGRAVMVYLDAGRLVLKRAVVAGGLVTEVADLEGLDAGAWIGFGRAPDGRFRGAYGAWRQDGTLRTRLVTFELPAVGP